MRRVIITVLIAALTGGCTLTTQTKSAGSGKSPPRASQALMLGAGF
jgi:hypothetical protein